MSLSPANPPPTRDGEVRVYRPTLKFPPAPPGSRSGPPLAVTRLSHPRPDTLFYVNGIQTNPEAHARTAVLVANLSERSVVGVFNASGGSGALGMGADLAQCAADWLSSGSAAVVERVGAVLSAPVNWGQHLARGFASLFVDDAPPVRPVNLLVDVQRVIPEQIRVGLVSRRLGLYNKATQSLYQQLVLNRGKSIGIVAHSQGNLVTCDALWAYTFSFGEAALEKVRVYSLASPAPAWPLGLRWRRLVYGHFNDPVPGVADPHNLPLLGRLLSGRTAGDWRTHTVPGNAVATHTLDYTFAAHDVERLVFLLNFANRIRGIHGLPPVGVPAGVR